MRVASYDIGSNSVILLVAERGPDGVWQKVHDACVVTRVAQGLDRSGLLHREPLERTAEALATMAETAAELGVDATIATGTAPFRRAQNGLEAAEQLSLAIGTPITVVSGDREAELALLATRRAFPELTQMTVVDLGGASTEVIAVDGDRVELASIDVGSVRLTERLLPTHPCPAADRARLAEALDDALASSVGGEVLRRGLHPVVGVAGTITTLATVSLEMNDYDDARVHGLSLTREEIDRIAEATIRLSVRQRGALPGLPAARAEVFAAGAWLTRAILDYAGADGLIVSDRGVRWGRLHAEFDHA
jgi:exopolyphosphatase/guanosine-5'-triphosphate,3'-diphosphate pyrophosphatase